MPDGVQTAKIVMNECSTATAGLSCGSHVTSGDAPAASRVTAGTCCACSATGRPSMDAVR